MRVREFPKFRPAALGRGLLSIAALSILWGTAAFGESPRSLVAQGNRLYRAGEYDQAMEAYGRASVDDPESPIIAFNEGNVFFREGDYQKAAERYEAAALATKDLDLEARCRYNQGNVALADAQRRRDGDPQKAIEKYQEAFSLYRDALRLRQEYPDAAHNLEVARILMKHLIDQLNQDPEGCRQRQEQNREMQEKLKRLIEEQAGEIGENQELQEQQQAGESVSEASGELAEMQEGTRKGTEELSKEMGEALSRRGQQPQAGEDPLEKAKEHLDKAQGKQVDASGDLQKEDLKGAEPDQAEALDHLMKAMEELGGEPQSCPNPQPQEGEGDQEEKKEQEQPQEQEGSQQQPQPQMEDQEPRDEQARDILAEERENQEKRKQRERRGVSAVEKDW